MRLTLEQAERALECGITVKAPNGNFWSARRNGKTRTWKTRPGEYQIPIRVGFLGNTYATERSEWNFLGEGPNADFQINAVAARSFVLLGNMEDRPVESRDGTKMTLDELLLWIKNRRESGWGMLRQLSTADTQKLYNFGYRGMSNAEAVLDAFKRIDKEITQKIENFERENPQ